MKLLSSTKIFANVTSGAGTVGGFFRSGDSTIYGISNNHVIANANNCHVNDAIFISGGPNANQNIGALQTWVTLNGNAVNYLDTAFFKIDNNVQTQWLMPNGVAAPNGFALPVDNQSVFMMLDNNTARQGTITTAMVNYNLTFDLCGSPFKFSHLMEIAATDGSPFSVPGQSGSIIFDQDNAIIGLLLGTNPTTTRSYAIPFMTGDVGTGILDVYDLQVV